MLLLSGCTSIPDADIAFLDRHISVGLSVDHARLMIERRGFSQIELRYGGLSVFNEKTESFDKIPLSFEEIVDQNIGFVDLIGQPEGELSCFAHPYAVFFSVGDRLICWTADGSDNITWRQAGWRGASP